jgi:uncharacterized membrane protein
MPNIRIGLAAAIAFSFSACSGGGSPLDSDLTLLGTEPFWAMQISKEAKTATFSRPSSSDMNAAYPVESKGEGGTIVLTSQSPEGDIVMTLSKKKCLDGMSDREYPWEATVLFNGQTLKGCAGPPQHGEG